MLRLLRSAAFALAGLLLVRAAWADDANFQFSKTANPIANWTYGWAASPGAAFQPFATETDLGGGLARWSAPNGASLSLACDPVVNEAGVTMLGGELSARIGSGGAATALRWTAPSSDDWHARATFVSEAGYFPRPSTAIDSGTQSGAGFGDAVAVGDVNGDGYADVLVGQPDWTNGQSQEGRVALYYGGPSGPSSTPAWTLESNVANAHAGASVAMGDFNHDGYMDFVIGAPGDGTFNGRIYLYRGSATGPQLLLATTGGVQFGQSVCFGDFNGDGLADLVVLEPPSLVNVLVWNGTTGVVPTVQDYGVAAHTATAPQVIASARDVNGDGIDDLLIGAPLENSSTGVVRVALGATGGIAHYPATPAGVLISGDQAGAGFGAAVAGIGDVDGDGYGDILVGSPAESAGGASAGRVQIFRGVASGVTTPASWTYDGPSGSRTGSAVAAFGDISGDGRPDFAVGARGYTNGQSGEGAAFVYYGGAGATATLQNTFEPNVANSAAGWSLAAGDVNGDGCTDLEVGAPGFATGGVYGRAYAVMNPGPVPVPLSQLSLRVLADGVVVARDSLDTGTGRDTLTLEVSVATGAGHTLDFEVSDAGGTVAHDAVAVDVAIEPLASLENPAGPVLTLGDQRYVPIQGPPAFDGAAFDPRARLLASNGHLYDVCGGLHSAGPDGPGIAWDPVTQRFWNITFDAGNQQWVVASFDTTTFTLTPVFDIPRVLTVPGTGADTLEDARGLAVDSSAVYVVDAGPAGLVPPANAWFKFTRAGVPLASRKGAAFSVNATADIVDDIVHSPFTSPIEPGRYLVAIEHIGIHVLDANGALVDSATWRSQGLTRSNSISAFAGLALDPVTGDLFLADNDRGQSQRWMRLTHPGATSYYLGDGSPGVVTYPVGECTSVDPLLWNVIPPRTMYCPVTPFVFGIAYRTIDQCAYAVDYGTGTLWKFDPREGSGVRVGETGVTSMWGLAYDAGRDRLYGLQNLSGSQVWSIQPRTAVATPLPQVTPYGLTDIGFEPNSGRLYGVSNTVSGPELVSIDRDTGAGVVVGPTRLVSGIDYDPIRGTLVGISSNDSLWSINPATGGASLIAKLPWSTGWEGLAVATVGVVQTLDVAHAAGRADVQLALAVAPQPSGARAVLTFALSQSARVRLELFDVGGRRVRRLADGSFAAGAHALTWDGLGDSGRRVAAGVYFARVEAAGRSAVMRVVRVE